ncbi:MAG: pSer/pThr/pTyr-binding forkhead associated (FHA) protein [Limisphaerales bacterium]|jgi:pSer/pThr/pTyr-binding forkhead associated (FHA) protein
MGNLQITSELLEGNFDLRTAPLKVGRGMDCDIQLKHKSVSRHHCILTERDGTLHIEDLGSTYGTYLNSTQVSDAYAQSGDTIRIGRIAIQYTHQEESIPDAEPVSPESARTLPPQKQQPKPSQAAKPITPPTAPVTPPSPIPALAAKKSVPKLPPQPAAAKATKPAQPKFVPPSRPSVPAAAKSPVAAARNTTDEAEEKPSLKRKPVQIGVYNRNEGRKKRTKAERPDYHDEADVWEDRAKQMNEGEGPDYAAEAEKWDQVWGKQRKLKGFFGFSGSPLGGLFGIFTGMHLKMRMVVVFVGMILIAGGLYAGYEKATANVLVPKMRRSISAKSAKETLINSIVEKAKKTGAFGTKAAEEE